jgi:nitrite reductase (NADH) small subunit
VSSQKVADPVETYVAVCRLDQIDREAGVAALVDGQAVAVFRTYDDQVFALSNYDPFGKASVLARGIVGTRTLRTEGGEEQVPFVASPLLKQPFDLRTGACLDDPVVVVPTYPVRVEDGIVSIGPHRETIVP